MSKIANKTLETTASVADFIAHISEKERQKDAWTIVELMKKESGFEPKLWGSSIIGFGSYHYKYESGREGDAPLIGFSPRKTEFALYLSSRLKDREKLLKQLGKHRTGKACVYIKKLTDVDLDILKKMIAQSLEAKEH